MTTDEAKFDEALAGIAAWQQAGIQHGARRAPLGA